jgi:hypothetical protein
MPGFIPTADTVKIDASARLFGQVLDNTMWFLSTFGPPTVDDLRALGTAFNDFWEANIVNWLSHDYQYLGCVVTDQSSETAAAINAPVTGVFGTIAEASMPGGSCLAVKFSTAGRGRSSRGRNYISGIPKVQVFDNAVDGDFATNITVGYNQYFAAGFHSNWTWVVVSHQTGGLPRAAGLPQEVLNASVSDLFIDSQRRRLTGRGT